MLKTALYLIPVPLGDTPVEQVLPSYNREVIAGIRHFIVENVRSARRFLKKSNPDICIDDLTFYELNRHTEATEVSGFLEPLRQGYATGVISEAGCPAVADPGAGCGGDRPTGTFACGSIGGPFVDIDVADGFGIQRAEFRFSGLPAYRGGRTDKENQAARTTGICRRADADIYRNALS